MCGIFGIWDLASPGNLASRVKAGTRIASHRGPDDEGFVLLSPGAFRAWGGSVPEEGQGPAELLPLALGHRRLSILDLSPAGHQPFRSADRRYWIVLNGEIYNYIELRTELERQGEMFVSQTDTEVVLAAWRSWGVECLDRFNGMWAFALFDRQEETLFCSRDRFGVKPFYCHSRPGTFVFASETKQLLGELGTRPAVNPATLADFLLWGAQCHTPDTFIQGIQTLPAGHFMRLTAQDVRTGNAHSVRYWRPSPEVSVDFAAGSGSLGQLLDDAVRLRLRSDVPLGVTLSGGLDSSSITCLASKSSPVEGSGTFRAFSAVYPDPKFSEESFARAAAERAGVELAVVRPESRHLTTDWDRFIWAMDEPFDSLTYYSNWKVYECIRAQNVAVLLNGQGGDELLLGYERYRVPFFLHLAARGHLVTLLREAWLGRTNARMSLALQVAYLLYFALPSLRIARRRRMARPFLRPDFFRFSAGRTSRVEEGSTLQPWPDFLIQEFEHDQLPHLLHHEDAVSMHFAVEARNPLLDYRLFNFVIGQDIRHLLRDGWSKAILREAMTGVLPETIRLRKDKMGFDTPTRRLLTDNAPFFIRLLDRNEADPALHIPALRKALLGGPIPESLLCGALSYLSWKERYGVA